MRAAFQKQSRQRTPDKTGDGIVFNRLIRSVNMMERSSHGVVEMPLGGGFFSRYVFIKIRDFRWGLVADPIGIDRDRRLTI